MRVEVVVVWCVNAWAWDNPSKQEAAVGVRLDETYHLGRGRHEGAGQERGGEEREDGGDLHPWVFEEEMWWWGAVLWLWGFGCVAFC